MCQANRNKLLILLLLRNRLQMKELLVEVGSKADIKRYVKDLNQIYIKSLQVNIIDSTEEILLYCKKQEDLVGKISEGHTYDFNDQYCRIAYILFSLIITDTYLNILDLSDYMNVSRGTVNNDLRKAKELLKKYNAEIVGVPNRGITLKCDEFEKRLILLYEVLITSPLTFNLPKGSFKR